MGYAPPKSRRHGHRIILVLTFLICVGSVCVVHAVDCAMLPAKTPLPIRLVTPVSSYSSRPGDTLSAILTEDVQCEDVTVLPARTRLEGRVAAVKKVGWGIRHETASLQLDFDRVILSSTESIGIKTRVVSVYDARETVANGVIKGIRSTDTPQGRINSRLKHLPTWNPYSDSFLLAYKLAFPFFPEPEIFYAAGTDMELVLTSPAEIPGPLTQVQAAAQFNESEMIALDDIAARIPARDFTADHKEADVINLAFVGSRTQVDHAFRAAGWTGSDRFSKSAFFKEFHAYLDNSVYAEAPMRPMLLGDSKPDLLWQKSLNTYSKRDHLRAWQWSEDFEGNPLWIGATTHDVGATLSLHYKRFVHHIDSDIDQEREKVISDLSLAGCVDAIYLAPRSNFPHGLQNATGDPIRTDGSVAIVRLKDCSSGPPVSKGSFHAGSRPFRYARQQILTFRSDIWRANIIYGAFDLTRVVRAAFRDSTSYDSQISHAESNHNVDIQADPSTASEPYNDNRIPCLLTH